MRTSDLEALNDLYPPPQGVRRSSEEGFADQIDAACLNARALFAEVFGDLDTTVGLFGVGWWFPHPGTARRILISDYLLSCIASIETNLVEAKLHYLEALDAFDKEGQITARAVSVNDETSELSVSHPRRSRGSDDLARLMRDLHVVGFFRAIGSALDCLAAAAIGAMAFPLNIQTASFSATRIYAANKLQSALSASEELWVPVLTLLAGDQDSDPTLIPWVLGYRNTLVHRARPLSLISLVPRPTLLRPAGPPHLLTEQRLLLPRDPKRSTIEILREAEVPVLTEDARDTMSCVFDTVRALCGVVSGELVSAWEKRRLSPSRLNQPRKQWPDVPSAPPSDFDGCTPGALPYEPDLLSTGTGIVHRMSAASLVNSGLDNWSDFD